MTKQQAIELLEVINNWCFQIYDERIPEVPENEYGIRIFELLPKYRKDFPENCFYTGEVYRKMERGSNCPDRLVACSYNKYANKRIGLLSLHRPRYYQSTCTNGYNLHNIILYIINTFNLKEPVFFGIHLLERTEEEAEVICFMDRKNFRRQKQARELDRKF